MTHPDQASQPYHLLGGEAIVRRVVDRFYDLMDSDPRAAAIRAMHPADLTSSRDKLFMFLSGWLGGPSLYMERYGHPMLRARHLPFAIDESARDAWLICMYQALDETPMEQALRDHLEEALFRTADFMRNQ
ncbi:group II truncated hemoglobin [Parachitinimonas caeni]|uniref:Group II truncated hemoglobin n=1 Tax=Parachitinimonas caeni TaxID=3031301 RepID=A0ABT7DXA3_9NEIS|nr:group II truncated hemoglobin [Parachitinimonas caeni]MDK2124661.1 group II truncated hemoglobin [Parachitinimonas caeni]